MARRILGDLVHPEVRSLSLTLGIALAILLGVFASSGRAQTDFERLADDPALIERVDLTGEEYAGETYAWTGRAPIRHVFRREDGPTTATLWLRWGSKGDHRAARLRIGERSWVLERSAPDGFTWWPVLVPREWWSGEELSVGLDPIDGSGPHAFLSELRLRKTAELLAPEHLIEAEDLEGTWREQRNVSGYSGRGFRVSNADGVAEDTLSSMLEIEPGRWLVWCRGYEGNGQDRSFSLAIDGEVLPETHTSLERDAFEWQLAGEVVLEGAKHRLTVRDHGPGFECVDAIALTRDASFDPSLADRLREGPPGTEWHPDTMVDRLRERIVETTARSHRHFADRQSDLESWKAARPALIRGLRDVLGLEPLPERTPLNVRRVGTIERDGYRIEKIVFESRPGFEVPANVYVPSGIPDGERRAAVLNPVGHWGLSKAEPVVQSRCIGLARLGYVALTYDAFGQGERAIDGNGHGEYHRSVLVGRNNMTYMVWDTVRALDYLLTRDDVDPERIACTGASGGGLNTLYAAAIDERIRVAVPVVYVTGLEQFLETGITHCPCSHVNGLAGLGDMGDVAALTAPRAQLFITATRDSSFTPEGARVAEAQARPAYRLFGADDRLAVAEFDTGHDYDRDMREAMYRFLAVHLGGKEDRPVREPHFEVERDRAVLACYPAGRQPTSAVTVRDLGRRFAEQGEVTRAIDLGAAVAPVRERIDVDAGWRSLIERLSLEAPPRRVERWSTGTPFELRLTWSPGGAEGPTIVHLGGGTPSEPVLAVCSAWVRVEGLAAISSGVRHRMVTDSQLLGPGLPVLRAQAIASLFTGLKEEALGDWIVCTPESSLALSTLLAMDQATAGTVVYQRGLPGDWMELFDGSPAASAELTIWRGQERVDLSRRVEMLGSRWRTWPEDVPLEELLD
ncbi:MAG: prolyl oligopeptidase family serine peptidase [Planctomycetota bacterium]